MEIIQNVFDINLVPKWFFNLLKLEKSIDLGEFDLNIWLTTLIIHKMA
jgi:hypothetical protein